MKLPNLSPALIQWLQFHKGSFVLELMQMAKVTSFSQSIKVSALEREVSREKKIILLQPFPGLVRGCSVPCQLAPVASKNA